MHMHMYMHIHMHIDMQAFIPLKVAASCPSGGVVRNDVLLHYATNSMPFGGLGTSGYGCAHGKFGFDAFTHKVGHATRRYSIGP